jgi:hypothetical protein
MNILSAIDHIQAMYDGEIAPQLNQDGVQASVVDDGVLIIPGTNEISDWTRYNFKFAAQGATVRWHRGFLRHAQAVYREFQPKAPKMVIGHSLGAASAQVVAYSLGIPAICFASPKPHCSWRKLRGQDKILNICRMDDAVTKQPPFPWYQHVGQVDWLNPKSKFGEDHRLEHYSQALIERGLNADWSP